MKGRSHVSDDGSRFENRIDSIVFFCVFSAKNLLNTKKGVMFTDQPPELVRQIRDCAVAMLDVANMLKDSGSDRIPILAQTEEALRLNAVRLFGYFPEPECVPITEQNFQLRPHRDRLETRTSVESLADSLECTVESLSLDSAK